MEKEPAGLEKIKPQGKEFQDVFDNHLRNNTADWNSLLFYSEEWDTLILNKHP